MAANPSTHQYEPLRVPPSWKLEERRVIQQLTDIFDDIYSLAKQVASGRLWRCIP